MEKIPTPKTGKGDPDKFIGDVFVDGITGPDAGVTVGWVHFSPGISANSTGPEPGAVWGEHITDEEYAEAVSRLG